jgi:hypothetical protein
VFRKEREGCGMREGLKPLIDAIRFTGGNRGNGEGTQMDTDEGDLTADER